MNERPVLDAGCDVARGANSSSVRHVLIVDDHPLMCEALAIALRHAFRLSSVRQAATLAEARAAIREHGPDAVLLDLTLPDVSGVDGVLTLRQLVPAAPVTVISAQLESCSIAAALGAGACGYLSKSLPRAQMIAALERMWAGETVVPECYDPEGGSEAEELARTFATLTPQQMNILRLICQGRPNKIISYELSIAEATVKTHIAAIMEKIRVRNRTQAALLASRAKIFDH